MGPRDLSNKYVVIALWLIKYAQSSNWESSVQVKKSKTIFETTSRSPLDFVEVLKRRRQIYDKWMLGHVLQHKKHENQPDLLSFQCLVFVASPIHQSHWNFTFFGSPGWPWRTLCTWCTWRSPTQGCRDSPGINCQHGAGFLLLTNSWGKDGRDVSSMSSK